MEEALKTALNWWQNEARYLTEWRGDSQSGGEYNVFGEEPGWVAMAHKAIDKANPPGPVPLVVDEPESRMLLKTQLVHLTKDDVNILDGSKNRSVRIDPYEDAAVKGLYRIWKSL